MGPDPLILSYLFCLWYKKGWIIKFWNTWWLQSLKLSYNGWCLLLEGYYFCAWLQNLKAALEKNYGYVHAKRQLSKGIKRTESDETSLKNWTILGFNSEMIHKVSKVCKVHLCEVVRKETNQINELCNYGVLGDLGEKVGCCDGSHSTLGIQVSLRRSGS